MTLLLTLLFLQFSKPNLLLQIMLNQVQLYLRKEEYPVSVPLVRRGRECEINPLLNLPNRLAEI